MSVTFLLLLDEMKRRHVIANSLELVEMTRGKVIPTHIPHMLWSFSATYCVRSLLASVCAIVFVEFVDNASLMALKS